MYLFFGGGGFHAIEEELEECRIVRCFGGSFESSFRSDFRIDFRSGFRSGGRNGRNGKEGRKRFKDGGKREGKETGIGDLGIGRTLRQFKQQGNRFVEILFHEPPKTQ